jgi:hypothetical protein
VPPVAPVAPVGPVGPVAPTAVVTVFQTVPVQIQVVPPEVKVSLTLGLLGKSIGMVLVYLFLGVY